MLTEEKKKDRKRWILVNTASEEGAVIDADNWEEAMVKLSKFVSERYKTEVTPEEIEKEWEIAELMWEIK